jgi:hypothetical protein
MEKDIVWSIAIMMPRIDGKMVIFLKKSERCNAEKSIRS